MALASATFAVDGIMSGTTNSYNCLTGNTLVATSITLNLLVPSPTATPAAPPTPRRMRRPRATTSSSVWQQLADDQRLCLQDAGHHTTRRFPPLPSDGSAERVWAVLCFPIDNNQGRKFFMINQAGNV